MVGWGKVALERRALPSRTDLGLVEDTRDTELDGVAALFSPEDAFDFE